MHPIEKKKTQFDSFPTALSSLKLKGYKLPNLKLSGVTSGNRAEERCTTPATFHSITETSPKQKGKLSGFKGAGEERQRSAKFGGHTEHVLVFALGTISALVHGYLAS